MAAQCGRCGARTEIVETFVRHRRSFRQSIGTLCPRCWAKAQTSSQKWLFCLNFFIGGLGLLFFFLLPGMELGSVFLNLFLLEMFVAAIILPHELGHALAARALGWRVFKIYVGLGRTLFTRRIFGFETEFKAIPMLGLAIATPKTKRHYRMKRFGFILAGPLANLLLAMPGLLMIPASQFLDFQWLEHGIAPARDFFYANLLALLVNLLPFDVTTPFGKVLSDGKALWQCLFLKGESIDRGLAAWYLMEGTSAHLKSQHTDARVWFEKGLNAYPGNLVILSWLGIVLIDLREFARARSCFLQLLQHPELNAGDRAIMLNNIAYVDVMLGGADLLAEADRYSQEAMQGLGWMAAVKGTRGCVLLELGEIDQAVALLREAMAEHELASAKAQNACSLSIAEVRRGALAEGRKMLAEARRLDPTCYLLARAEEAVRNEAPSKSTGS